MIILTNDVAILPDNLVEGLGASYMISKPNMTFEQFVTMHVREAKNGVSERVLEDGTVIRRIAE